MKQGSMTKVFTLEVSGINGTMRLDAFCSSVLTDITRSQLKAGLQSAKLNGHSAKLSSLVRAGDRITVVWNNPLLDRFEPEALPLTVIYEDTDVIVVNKEAGMVTHPAQGNWTGTLVQALAYYRLHTSSIRDEIMYQLEAGQKNKIPEHKTQDLNGETPQKHKEQDPPSLKPQKATFYGENSLAVHLRTGIVHRLDKDTSGVIITARTAAAEVFLKQEFKAHRTEKYYIALVSGVPQRKTGIIETSVFRDTHSRIRFAASADLNKGKYARSRYKVLRVYNNYALVLFKIDTGRTHQIRLHARFIGCPIVGDSLYGNKGEVLGKYGLMLHAYRLGIALPSTGEKTVFTAPLPQRFLTVLRFLQAEMHETGSATPVSNRFYG